MSQTLSIYPCFGSIYDKLLSRGRYTPPGWYQCGNLTHPLRPDWKEALAAAAQEVRPFVLNGTVVGIFYGDEISCTFSGG